MIQLCLVQARFSHAKTPKDQSYPKLCAVCNESRLVAAKELNLLPEKQGNVSNGTDSSSDTQSLPSSGEVSSAS